MNETEEEVSGFYVRPCVDGNSSTGEYFNFSVSVSRCQGDNCTATVSTLRGASIISPILLSLTGISGQIAALIYLHGSSRPTSHRTTFYVMLATLIWTDLVGKLITTPQPVLFYVYGHWIGGESACNLHGYSMSLIGIVTHLLVAAMAMERYLGIRCGYFYNRNVTLYRTRILLGSLWLFGVLYCTLPLMGVGEFKLHYPGSWCHINQHICSDQPLPTRIFANLYSAINLTCLFLIVFCNFMVVGTLLKMRVTQYRPSASCRRMSTRKKPKERELQMIILLVIITITFICSWAPHDQTRWSHPKLLMIKNQIWPPAPNENPMLDMRAIRLVSINQIVDPWSYIICRIIFRSKLWGCCQRVIIGKVGSIRLPSRGDREESSGFYSIAGPKLKFSSLKRLQKRASLPNPSDMELQARMGRGSLHNTHPDKRRSDSIEHSLASTVSDQECKVDIQNCFPISCLCNKKTESQLTLALPNILPEPPATMNKNNQNDSITRPGTSIETTATDQNFLSPETMKYLNPKTFIYSSFHGKTEKEKKENVSCGNLVSMDSSQVPLLQDSKSTTSMKPIQRSNSWCCTDEYTFNKRKTPSVQKMKRRTRFRV